MLRVVRVLLHVAILVHMSLPAIAGRVEDARAVGALVVHVHAIADGVVIVLVPALLLAIAVLALLLLLAVVVVRPLLLLVLVITISLRALSRKVPCLFANVTKPGVTLLLLRARCLRALSRSVSAHREVILLLDFVFLCLFLFAFDGRKRFLTSRYREGREIRKGKGERVSIQV